MRKFFLLILFVFICFFRLAATVSAITYDLVAPSGSLSRGQEIKFTINIDTEGTTVTTTQIGMNYQTSPLQYVGTTAGNAMTSVSVSESPAGSLLLTGTNQAGFSGKGTFAYVSFKIIAASPGSTTLCSLWAPTTVPTPTTAPTGFPAATSTPGPTNQPTGSPTGSPPPTTGSTTGVTITILLGIVFIGGYLALYNYKNNLTYDKKIVKKTTRKKK